MAFKESVVEQAYLKAGLMGFAGSGKTFTATKLAIGLHQYCQSRKVSAGEHPVFFMDTETGSDWVKKHFDEAGITLMTDKTRAFTRLVPAIEEVSKLNAILMIDSISHFWKELQDSYIQKKRRERLTFQDWAWLKLQWGKFTDAFVNSPCHIIMCGRAGHEYDFFEDETGKKELTKTGVKMKAETETGYEPSVLVLMEKHQELEKGHVASVYRTGQILKDRADVIDGKTFRNPTFEDFLPHIEHLALGHEHIGTDTSQTSEQIVPPDSSEYRARNEERAVVLDEIQCTLVSLFPSTSAASKKSKMELLEKHFDTKSWERVKTMDLEELKARHRNLEADVAATK